METEPEKKPRKYIKRARRTGKFEYDANFAQQSRVYQKMLLNNIAAFTAKDPELTPAYADVWLQTILAFEKFPSDEAMMDTLQERVDNVNEFIKSIMVFVDELEYFAGKAFKTKPRRMYEFGFASIRTEAAGTSPKFLIHCYGAIVVAEEYVAELTAAGAPPALLSDFSTLLDTGARIYVEMELAKRYRIRATTNRVDLYNQLHEYWAKPRKVAALIYRNDKEALDMWERG